MFKRIKALKDLLWAAGIGLCLLALFVGLVSSAFTAYHGDRGVPAMQLRREKDAAQDAAAGGEATSAPVKGRLKADGTLHPLAKTPDAGEEYLGTLTLLCDSSFALLRSAGLCDAAVWSSETGSLPMNAVDTWMIRSPADGTLSSLNSLAQNAQPAILILAIGSDGLESCDKKSFEEAYAGVIQSVAHASPKTKIVCLSLCSVTSAYAGADGLSKDKAAEVNDWIKTVCIDTGAYYGELTDTLCLQGWLRADYADGSGRALNNAGLREFLNYLRDHSAADQ